MHELINTVGFQTSLLLLVALSGYLLAALTNQSAVVWQIIMGIVIGPSALDLITYTGFVSNLAYLGGVILLFVIGLEFKINDLLSRKIAFIALIGVILPWISGYTTANLFGFDNNASIFIGTVLTATSIAITANVLHELGQLKTIVAKTIIGAAVIDDILALFALTLTTNLTANSMTTSALLLLVFKISAFLIIGFLLGYHIFTKLISKVDASKFAMKYPEFIFVLAMTIAFFYALIAETFGISAIIGAFIVGVFLEGVTLKNSRHFRDGADYLRIIFASIFFVSLGILANLHEMNTTTLWLLVTLTLVALVSKIIGCGLPAKLCGFNWNQASIIGVGMAPRGEVAMIVALIGLKKQIIGQPIYVTVVLMSLITTIITPIILRALLGAKKNGEHIPI